MNIDLAMQSLNNNPMSKHNLKVAQYKHNIRTVSADSDEWLSRGYHPITITRIYRPEPSNDIITDLQYTLR